MNQDFVDELPQIAGVADHNVPPQIDFSDGFATWGSNAGVNDRQPHHPSDLRHQRPPHLDQEEPHDQGGVRVQEHRREHPLQQQRGGHLQVRPRCHRPPRNQQRKPHRQLPAGRGGQRQRGLPLGGDELSAAVGLDRPRRRHLAREQQADRELRPPLGLLHGVTGEVQPASPSSIRMAPTPARAGARAAWPSPGPSLAPASYGADYPEKPYKKAFAPRLGADLRGQPQDPRPRGLGHFLRPRVLPRLGWRDQQAGFSSNVAFSSSLGGLEPAFFLHDGFPQDFTPPPFIQSDFRNGQGICTARSTATSGPARTSGT